MEKQITVELANEVLTTIVLEATAKGELILNSVKSLNFLVLKAKECESAKAENEILKKRVEELELLTK